MSTKTTPTSQPHKAARKRPAAKAAHLASKKSKGGVLIKPLCGTQAFELMKALGIVTEKGKPTAAYQ